MEFNHFVPVDDEKFQYEWAMGNIWTFEITCIATLLAQEVWSHKHILVPFAGMTRWHKHPDITYIDLDATRPDPKIVGDALEILPQLVAQGKKYDLIISDPPFSFHQAVHSYGNEKLQDITYIKRMYDQLLVPGGVIIHFGFNSTGMGMMRQYKKEKLMIVALGGSHNDILVLKERKMKQTLMDCLQKTSEK